MQNLSQYVTYRSLLAKRQGQGFTEVEVTDILRQVLSQLTRLHELKQAHGAISLDTVVYDSNRMHIVLLPENWMSHPIYLAPEVAQTRQATPAADIYALGVFTIVLLTGRSPEELKTSDNEWNWEDRCNVSNRFIQMLNMALFDSSDFRYVNAGQMLRSLQPILNNIDLPLELPITSPAISENPESPDDSLDIEPLDIEPLDFDSNDSDKISQLKAELPNSPTYRKATSSKEVSKTAKKSRIRILFVMFLGIGITAMGIVGTYFYIQSKSAETTSKNLQAMNLAMRSFVMESAIARFENTKKTNENSNKLISLAKDKYENSGNLAEAQAMLQTIPANSSMRSKADLILKQWQEDTKKNNDLIKKAEIAIENGNWQQAIDTVKDVSSTPYWQIRSKKIAENAKQQQLAKKIAEPSPVDAPTIISPPVLETAPPEEPSAPVQEPPPSYSAPSQESSSPRESPPPPRAAN